KFGEFLFRGRGRRPAARPSRRKRRLDFSILDILAQCSPLAFIKVAVLVQVVFIKDFLGRRAVRPIRPSKTARAASSRANKFVRGQFAISIFVELGQCRRGVSDLISVNDAITVCVERGDDKRRRWSLAIAARTWLAGL